ncbi:MAG: fumarate/nitrate reduction transcriptional regulator Fnr [Methylococcales bacterium]|jgi:CRP/FNR family transcriptional regulator|nr:fumarate/nitrate reduction transcriptional regulator Fnr [Methylococcales bacterium]MBT7443543.1 fumarate/nitrate reduction transcriptional regulator Fnr [Methylococcales bacterium]
MTNDTNVTQFTQKRDCSLCNLSEICLPEGLTPDEMGTLDSIIKRRKPKQKGEFIFRDGDTFTSLYAVRSGSVKTFATGNDGSTMVTGFHLSGEILGLEGINCKQHVGNAKALETTSICEIPFNQLSALGQDIPKLQQQVFRVLSNEIGQEQQVMLLLGKKSSEERIASFLLRLASRYHTRGFAAKEFNLSMSRSDIANYLGLAVETVSRIFTRLTKQGIVNINRKLVMINDESALRDIANEPQPDTDKKRTNS